MSHTKEPWKINTAGSAKRGEDFKITEFYVYAPDTQDDTAICSDVIDPVTQEPSEANARRIVACVNACAGISTESLEGECNAVIGWNRTASKLLKMGKQRDDILSALESAVRWAKPMADAPIDSRPTWFTAARAAIARAKGGAA